MTMCDIMCGQGVDRHLIIYFIFQKRQKGIRSKSTELSSNNRNKRFGFAQPADINGYI